MAKLQINCVPVVSADETIRHITYARTLGFKFVSEKKRPPLIVLGGGASIREHIDEVKASSADKWIIGSAFKFWSAQGVRGSFFSVHPSKAALNNIHGVRKAVVATVTHPEVLDQFKHTDARVELFDLVRNGVVTNGATSATVIPCLAVEMGYREVTFYGCESNYGDSTHAYMSVADPYLMKVKCGEAEYLTGAEFLMQAEFLAALIKERPGVFKERSGGLLRALISNDYDVIAISKTLHESRSDISAEQASEQAA